MSISRKILMLAAPAALLALSACATGFPAQVSRYQAMPAPQGQSFFVESADPADRGGLEFSRYADHVRQHMLAQGYSEAPTRGAATLVVAVDYGVDDGKQQVVTRPGYSRFGWGAWGPYRPIYSRFGYGRGSPFYYGWDDPFWYSPFGAGYGDIDVYTVYNSFLDVDIRRASDGQSVFEGTARARSRTDDLRTLVPNLVEAMFTGFPGNSGEQVRITVPPPPRGR
ncbi:MAG TPA: DUF4136 domain-containing protein [Allosphingosinicella sp.]|nr:DUF4136 domain-containing protein [Allosphingosinicella sp.]